MPINIRSINGVSVANDGTATIGGGATYAQAAAASAAEAALYDGPKVDTFAELDALTSAEIDVGDLVRVIETGAVYERVASGADFTTAGGIGVRVSARAGMLFLSDFPAAVSLSAAAARAVALGVPLYVDMDRTFAEKWTPPAGLVLRGPHSDDARLIYTGTGDGVEIVSAIDIDGIIIDGNLSDDAVPTATSEAGCLAGIHGPMTGTPGYLSGVRIGRLRVQNTRRRTGLALINLSDFKIGYIESRATYGHAFHMAGLKNGSIGSYKFDRVGNLAVEGSRLGSGIAFFAEGDSGKLPAEWYTVAGIQETDNVDIGPGQGSRTTDSAIYFHDTENSGVKNVSVGHFQGHLLGKDGVKARDGARGIKLASAQMSKVGMRFATIDDAGTADCDFTNVVGEYAGYDVIGEWLDGSPGTRNYTSEANGLNQTLNQTPGGFGMVNVARCNITGIARAVRDAPHNSAEGSPFFSRGCTDCYANVVTDDADAVVRLGDLIRCEYHMSVTNAGRNLTLAAGGAFVYVDDDDDASVDNILRVTAIERSGSAAIQYPCRIDGTGTGWDVEVAYSGPFTMTGGIVTRSNSAAFKKYRNDPLVRGRESLAFDGSGNTTVTHNAGTTPAFFASHEGGFAYAVRVTSISATEAVLALYQVSDGAAITDTSRTISWQALRLRQGDGFPY
jgi:hypothetical protein